MTNETQHTYEFRTEIKQLLHILIHSLYTDREIFLRELISNASDALSRVQFEMLTNPNVRDSEAELAIRLSFDNEAKTLTISDTGVGLTRDEMIENLGTIAHSGAATFLAQLQKSTRPATDLIGQFGVGFYSAFMVADRIRVVSRSFRPEAEAMEWESDGSSAFSIEPATREQRGTDVILHLKDDAAEFLNAWRLEQIIKKHSDFVAFPIYLQDKIVNQRTSIWRRTPKEVTDDEYNAFYKQLTFDPETPLLHMHYVADAPVDIHSVLFVPRSRERGMLGTREERGLKLYSRHVLIQEQSRDLLPTFFRFVEGVLDSEDIPLNVSRETVQNNRLMTQIQRALTGRLIKELTTLAAEKPEDYTIFWKSFGQYIKEGIATDPTNRDSLLPLLRFHSTDAKTGTDATSLATYVERMQPNQTAIYYILGEDLTSARRSPHLDPLRAQNMEALALIEPVDSFMIMALHEFEGKKFANVDSAELDLPPADETTPEKDADEQTDADFTQLINRFAEILGDRVQEVRASKSLRDNPCRLVSPDGALNKEMQRVLKLLDQPYDTPKKILELNRTHALIQDLAFLNTQPSHQELVQLEIEQLFATALLQEGIHPNPASMADGVQTLLAQAAHLARRG